MFHIFSKLLFSDDPESILIIILDTNPVWWGQRALKREWEVSIIRIIVHNYYEFMLKQLKVFA